MSSVTPTCRRIAGCKRLRPHAGVLPDDSTTLDKLVTLSDERFQKLIDDGHHQSENGAHGHGRALSHPVIAPRVGLTVVYVRRPWTPQPRMRGYYRTFPHAGAASYTRQCGVVCRWFISGAHGAAGSALIAWTPQVSNSWANVNARFGNSGSAATSPSGQVPEKTDKDFIWSMVAKAD